VIDGEYIHLVWRKFGSDVDDVFYLRSTDGGDSWGNPINLSESQPVNSTGHSISADGSRVISAWYRSTGGVYYRKSNDSGGTWLDIRRFTWEPYWRPTLLKYKPDSLFMFFGATHEFNYVLSDDFGDSWGNPIVLSPWGVPENDVAISSSWRGVHTTAQNSDFTHAPEIYYTGSADGGITWVINEPLTDDDQAASQWPALGADSADHVYVTWFDHKYSGGPRGNILMRRSMDGGGTWNDEEIISFSHLAHASAIAANHLGVFVAWDDYRDGPYDSEIYIRASYDLGETWQQEQRVTYATHNSKRPYLLIDGPTLHLFWQDARDNTIDRPEIYYKRGHLIQTGVEAEQSKVSLPLQLNISPNPFNVSVRIEYSVEGSHGLWKCAATRTRLEVYDILGRKVETLSDEYRQKGKYVVKWNASNCRSGIYFIYLTYGRSTIIKKALLVR